MTQNTDKFENQSHEFLNLIKEYAGVLSQSGLKIRALQDPGACPLFDRLTNEDKAAVLFRIKNDLELYYSALKEGQKLTDSPRLMWRCLVKTNLRPCPDIFDKMENEDVVILYDLGQRQIFQNLKFFEYVSVTLERLFCVPWYEYAQREKAIEKQIYEAGVSMATGKTRTTFSPDVDEHIVTEVETEELYQFRLKVRWMSPVFSKDQVAGAILINRCSML